MTPREQYHLRSILTQLETPMSDSIRFPEGIEKYVRNLLTRITELERQVKKLEQENAELRELGTVSLHGERDAYEHFLSDL
jgi:predicted RNase H-like nuclease (RuvC/YqgF family)